MSITTPLLATDPRRLGPYVLLWRLGGGGMGVVYLGEAQDERLVAIKGIRPELADDSVFLARFRQEVEAASRVAGFCTARVIGADLEAERPWFATEYVDGPTLQQAVKRSGALRGQALSTFALGVAEALDAIHEAGVVHRDLKPSNVLLARNAPKVIDFGIARALDAVSLTQTGKVIGTVTWLAPEQLRSDRASPLSDVFAWGGLVAYAATGRPPFGAGPAEVVVHRILNEDADLDGTDGELRTMVELALAKHPEERPSARALLARLLGAGTRKDNAAAMASRVVKDTWTGTNAWQQQAAMARGDPPAALRPMTSTPPAPMTGPALAGAVTPPPAPVQRLSTARPAAGQQPVQARPVGAKPAGMAPPLQPAPVAERPSEGRLAARGGRPRPAAGVRLRHCARGHAARRAPDGGASDAGGAADHGRRRGAARPAPRPDRVRARRARHREQRPRRRAGVPGPAPRDRGICLPRPHRAPGRAPGRQGQAPASPAGGDRPGRRLRAGLRGAGDGHLGGAGRLPGRPGAHRPVGLRSSGPR